jgi:predicted MPP superfamily phosphohydrolase
MLTKKTWTVKWSLRFVLFITSLILAAQSLWFEPQSLTFKSLDIKTPAFPEGTRPIRAVLISDIHIDNIHMPPKRVNEIVKRINSLKPDVVLLAGDYIDGDYLKTGPKHGVRSARSTKSNIQQEEGIRALGQLNAPLGVYAVMGNHDCWWDCKRVRTLFSETPIILLENESYQIKRGEGDIWIIGVEDGQTQLPDFQKAAEDVPREAASLILEHNPGLFDWPSNTHKLMLSGHTHAGQVRFPIIGSIARMSRHTEDTADGWFIKDDRTLIVTRGLGTSGLPVRFMAPPQIMLLTISPGKEPQVKTIRP